MRLCRFKVPSGEARLGVITERGVADLSEDQSLPQGMAEFLEAGAGALARARAIVAAARPLEDAPLLAPILPRHFYAIGLNYADHAREMGRPIPDQPALFMKPSGCVIGPNEPIIRPRGEDTLDYEGELGIVIGRAARRVTRAQAMDHVAGFVIVNDVSVRAHLHPDRLVLAKGGDGFGPLGPWITTPDEVDWANGLRIRTWVDDEVRQDSSTNQMIFPPDALIELLSAHVTLHPGDVITTGSPLGSGMSFKPPAYLQPGQIVRIEIEGLGELRNPVRGEI